MCILHRSIECVLKPKGTHSSALSPRNYVYIALNGFHNHVVVANVIAGWIMFRAMFLRVSKVLHSGATKDLRGGGL